jgi:drug/metabolite transporter (DMT)-like permease
MIVAGLMFATMGVFVKMGSEHFEAAELALYRSLISLAFVIGILVVNKGTVRTAYPGAHLVRGVAGAISLIAYFYAITQLPLATGQTLNYTSPLFLAIGTVVVLGERFSLWLVAAIALGFLGVALLLQPTFQGGKEGAAMIGLFSGVLSSWAYLSVRTLGKLGEPDWRVLFWFAIIASVLCVAWQTATSTFHPITWANAWILLAMGTAGTLAQLAMTRAY